MRARIILFALVISLFAFNSHASVSLIMPNLTGANGTQITVPVKVKDYINIIGTQGTIYFNPAIVSFVSVQDFGLPGMNAGSFGTGGTGTGDLTFLWFDGTLVGVTLADSATIFSITFNIIGSPGGNTPLNFTNTPTQLEIVNTSMAVETVVPIDGSITVAGGINEVILYFDTISGTQGTLVNVSLRAVDFQNLNTIQGTVGFDPAVVTFTGISAFGLPALLLSDFNTTQAGSGKIMFSWNDGTLQGQNMADHAALFTLTFQLSGSPGSISPISFPYAPTVWEISDSLFNTLNIDSTNGYVRIENLTGMAEEDDLAIGNILGQNYPNPVDVSTNIPFTLEESGLVRFYISDASGKIVYQTEEVYPAGKNVIQWDASRNDGSMCPQGNYFYTISTTTNTSSRELSIIR